LFRPLLIFSQVEPRPLLFNSHLHYTHEPLYISDLDGSSVPDHLLGFNPSILDIQSSLLVLGLTERDMSAPGQLGSEELREDGVNWEHGYGGRSGRLSRGENVDQAR
jgi:hypothetical protein